MLGEAVFAPEPAAPFLTTATSSATAMTGPAWKQRCWSSTPATLPASPPPPSAFPTGSQSGYTAAGSRPADRTTTRTNTFHHLLTPQPRARPPRKLPLAPRPPSQSKGTDQCSYRPARPAVPPTLAPTAPPPSSASFEQTARSPTAALAKPKATAGCLLRPRTHMRRPASSGGLHHRLRPSRHHGGCLRPRRLRRRHP